MTKSVAVQLLYPEGVLSVAGVTSRVQACLSPCGAGLDISGFLGATRHLAKSSRSISFSYVKYSFEHHRSVSV